MLLYEHPLSSYAQKVKIALREKGEAATFREFDAAAAKMAASKMYVRATRRRECRDYCLEWMIKSGGLVVVQAGLEARNIRFPWPGAMEVPAG